MSSRNATGQGNQYEEGQVLLGTHVALTDHLINRLYDLGFDFLYVEDCRTEDLFAVEPISVETQKQALAAVSSAYAIFAQDLGYRSLWELSVMIDRFAG